MAVLGWIALGLVTGVLASTFRGGEGGPAVLARRCAVGMVGALLAGLAATAAGVGPIGDFFHTGTWLIAFGGAVLALVGSELARTTPGRREITGRPWTGRVGGESERLDRNW
jgi:uncharacterized membrane protein YeaQ/YmgE (transglycosylase-associated protein family)